MKIPCLRIYQIVLAITFVWESYAQSAQFQPNIENISTNIPKESSAVNYNSRGDTSNNGNSRSSSTSFNSEPSPNDLSSGSNSYPNYQYDYYPSYYHVRNKWCPYGVTDPRCIPRTGGTFDLGGFGDSSYGTGATGFSTGSSGGFGDGEDKGAGAGGLGGLGGLAGLAGLAGLKGLLPVAVPLLLLLLLGPLLLIPLLLFLPIPVVTVPVGGTGRSSKSPYVLQSNYLSFVPLVAKALTGEECIERISCEIASRGNGYKFFDWIKKWAEESSMKENKWFQKFYRGIHLPNNASNNDEDNACRQLKCNPSQKSLL